MMQTEIMKENGLVIWKLDDELEDPGKLKGPMEEFRSSELRTLLLDMSGKEWLSSSEIGVVMWIFKELDNMDHELCLLSVSPFVMKTVRVTGIDQLLSVYENREEALAAVAGGD